METPLVPFAKVLWDNKAVRYIRGFSPGHDGIDWAMPIGIAILASQGGVISSVGVDGYGGRWIHLKGDDGKGYLSNHISGDSFGTNFDKVSKGTRVVINKRVHRGQVIARSGNTGKIYVQGKPITDAQRREGKGAHLHFEVRANSDDTNSSINPIGILKFPVTVTPAPVIVDTKDQQINELRRAAAELQKEMADVQKATENKYAKKIDSLNTELLGLRKDKELYEVERKAKEADLYKQIQELEEEVIENKIDLPAIGEYDISAIGHDILEETVPVDNLISRWGSWVDSKFKSDVLKSLLKYDIFVLIGSLVSWGLIEIPNIEMRGDVKAFVITTLAIIYKLIITRYDTNKDGKLSSLDYTTLSDYKIQP